MVNQRLSIVLLLLCLNACQLIVAPAAQQTVLVQPESSLPSTLEEAHAALEKMLSFSDLSKIDAMSSAEEMSLFHFGLGMRLRNTWGLWQDSELARYMQTQGFIHPDDMSAVILETFWCKRHGKAFVLADMAADYAAYWAAAKEAEDHDNRQAETARSTMQSMLLGLQLTQAEVPVISLPARASAGLRARSLAAFKQGVLIGVRHIVGSRDDDFVIEGYYFDLLSRSLHKILLPEMTQISSVALVDDTAWFAGHSKNKAMLIGVSSRERKVLSLPVADQVPQLGIASSRLLAIYPKAVFSLTDTHWETLYAGEVALPKSGPPPTRYGNYLFFRDEGRTENQKRLWWLSVNADPLLTSFDQDFWLITAAGPRWENVSSYAVTSDGMLWLAVGEGYNRKSLLRRSPDGLYAIAIMNNSVDFSADFFGSEQTDQGLSLSAIAPIASNTLILVGDQGLYRLHDNHLEQLLAFTQTKQEIAIEGYQLAWRWTAGNILPLSAKAYFISGTFGGMYLLEQTMTGKWQLESLDEKLGAPLIW